MQRHHKKRHIEEEAESWAVSYADLLMVLMSFFIVFFNIDDSGEKSLVDIIAKGFNKEENRNPASSGGTGVGAGNGTKSGALQGLEDEINKTGAKIKIYDQVGDLENEFGNSKVEGKTDSFSGVGHLMEKTKAKEELAKRGLIFELSNDVFDVGAYELNDKVRFELDQVLDKLKEHEKKLTIIAIGHADKIPMSATRKVISTNFILSSLRASKAVEYIISKGFDPYWVSGKAVSVENRSTRSLSLRIMER